MTRQALIAVTVAVAALAGAAAPAGAKIKRGSFAGKTSAGDPVGFKVDRRGNVRSFFYVEVTLRCNDDDTVDTDRVSTPRKIRFPVTQRTFGIRATNKKTGFRWKVDANFRKSGRSARGTLRVTARFNEQNIQDPNGTVACDTGALTWTARRE